MSAEPDTPPAIALAADLTAESLRQSLRARRERRRSAANSDRLPSPEGPYALAAAVLHVFDPGTIEPFEAAADPRPALDLNRLSTPAIGWRDRRYRSLTTSARRSALAALGSRQRMRDALAANPDRPRTGVQVLFEAWLSGTLDPARLRYGELEELRLLYSWGLSDYGGLPEPAVVDGLRAKRARTAIFDHLVDDSFTGREAELLRLRAHVGVRDRLAGKNGRGFSQGHAAPLVIHGPGGTGKTALVGAFLMDYVEQPAGAWFPFVYLAFDSPILDVREPWTLLAAACEQIEIQAGAPGGDAPDALTLFLEDFRLSLGRFRDERAALLSRASRSVSQTARIDRARRTSTDLYGEFAVLLNHVVDVAQSRQGADWVPIVLVLDTFEEVMYRADEDLYGLWSMLSTLQATCPNLRVIIAGRAEPRPFTVDGRAPEWLPLGDLAEDDALTVLARLGIADPATQRAIVHQVGTSPLSLRLAARAAQDEPVGRRGFDDLPTHQRLPRRLPAEMIRGQLYRRILGHIHDADVARLAHPGMVLRRVTPEIIRDVLAPVCLAQPVDLARARKLFDELKREHALVRLADDASLRYREEVRGPMLTLLAADKPEQVQALHEETVAYYARFRSVEPTERAEELYHRMMLRQPAGDLQDRWMPGAERYLAGAIPELPPKQLLWLAQHMSIELPPDLRARADQAEWERVVGYKVLEMIRHGLLYETLVLLRERSAREPDSALYAIEIRVLTSMDRLREAFVLSRHAVGALSPNSPSRQAEVLWLGAQAARAAGHLDEAVRALREATEITASLSTGIPRLQALTEWVALIPEAEAETVRHALADALDRLTPPEIDQERSLVRLACVRLGAGYPRSIRRVLPMVLGDFLKRVQNREIDVAPLLLSVANNLSASTDQLLVSLADALRHGARSLSRDLAVVIDLLASRGSMDALDGLLHLMSAEAADLGAATLGGLDAYREDFESRAAPEAMA